MQDMKFYPEGVQKDFIVTAASLGVNLCVEYLLRKYVTFIFVINSYFSRRF